MKKQTPQAETAQPKEPACNCCAEPVDETETIVEQKAAITTAEIEAMLTAIQDKNQQLEEKADQMARLQADFDNFRRRSRLEKEELADVITQKVLAEFLPVLDNFDRALSAGAAQDAGGILSGVEMISRQLNQVLSRLGIEPLNAKGSQFDPNRHEAVARVEDPDQPDGMVAEELQKGYLYKQKVLRPSMVKVISNC